MSGALAGGSNVMMGGGKFPEIETHKPKTPGSTLSNVPAATGARFESTVDKKGWEQAEFPILCENCLGPNPFVRMVKEDFGRECKICQRPTTLFRWKPGAMARYKRNEICQTCARLKNCCQTCLFDLEYGLPIELRDKYLAEHDRMIIPNSHVNRDFYLMEQQKKIEAGDLPYNKEKNPMLEKLARRNTYYKRNEAKICSFFVKGACNRGDECPYRHEMPPTGELADQNMRDRFHGRNDPLAAKLVRRAQTELTLTPPEDKTITTLYIGGVQSECTDKDVRDAFYTYGEIKTVKMLPKQKCAFVVYAHREAAELAAERCYKVLKIKGSRVRIQWAEKAGGGSNDAASSNRESNLPKKDPLAKQAANVSYPSQNTWNQGNAPLEGAIDGVGQFRTTGGTGAKKDINKMGYQATLEKKGRGKKGSGNAQHGFQGVQKDNEKKGNVLVAPKERKMDREA